MHGKRRRGGLKNHARLLTLGSDESLKTAIAQEIVKTQINSPFRELCPLQENIGQTNQFFDAAGRQRGTLSYRINIRVHSACGEGDLHRFAAPDIRTRRRL